MITPKKFWKYKAINENQEIVEGIYESNANGLEVILQLRQKQLQVLVLSTASEREIKLDWQLFNLRQKQQSLSNKQLATNTKFSLIHRIKTLIFKIFRN